MHLRYSKKGEIIAERIRREMLTEEVKARIFETVRRDLAKFESERRDAEERREKIMRKQISFLEVNKDKNFYISQEFHRAALEELRKTFQFQQERGMMLAFKECGGAFYETLFHGSNWVERNLYGWSTPIRSWVKEKGEKEETPDILGSFGFRHGKIAELQKRTGGIVVECHTHPSVGTPSSGDLFHSFCGIVIGFESQNSSSKELLKATFYKNPYEQRGGIPFPFPEELYQQAVSKCNPRIRFFYAERGKKLKEIPLLTSP